MNSPLFKPFFWLGAVVALLVSIFVMLLSPIIGILLLLVLLLVFVMLILLIPSLWQAVKPRRKEKKSEFSGRSKEQPLMMLESCSGNESNIIIDRPVFVIGRASDCDYRPANTDGISFHHCKITYREATRQFFIEDLGSTYGTCLHDRPLNKNTPMPLMRNSMVTLHKHRYTFKPVAGSESRF